MTLAGSKNSSDPNATPGQTHFLQREPLQAKLSVREPTPTHRGATYSFGVDSRDAFRRSTDLGLPRSSEARVDDREQPDTRVALLRQLLATCSH